MNPVVEALIRASVAQSNATIASLLSQKANLESDLALVATTIAQESAKRDALLTELPEEEETAPPQE